MIQNCQYNLEDESRIIPMHFVFSITLFENKYPYRIIVITYLIINAAILEKGYRPSKTE